MKWITGMIFVLILLAACGGVAEPGENIPEVTPLAPTETAVPPEAATVIDTAVPSPPRPLYRWIMKGRLW